SGVVAQLLELRGLALAELHHRGDLLAPALVGDADDDAVEHGRVVLEGLLDLLGVDLLATRVDGRRAAAQEGDRAVGLPTGVVARDGVAATVLRRDERRRGLRLVLVVAERDVAAPAHLADLVA